MIGSSGDIRAAREIMHKVAGLPGHQKIPTYLHHFQGWTHGEIAAYLDEALAGQAVKSGRK